MVNIKRSFRFIYKNNWIDENGDIFFIYTNEKLKQILNISSPNKLSKIKKELTRADLFSQIRVGLNKPNKLYLKPEVTKADVYYITQQENDVEQQYSTDVSNSYIQKYDNNTSGNIKMIHHDISKNTLMILIILILRLRIMIRMI